MTLQFAIRFTCSVAAMLANIIVAVAAHGGPTAPIAYQVTSVLFDTDAFGSAVLLQSDDTSAGSAAYLAGDVGVVSQIDSTNTDWNLDLRGTSRGVHLTVVTATGESVPGLPSGPNFYVGRVVSRCFSPAGDSTAYSWFKVTDDSNCAMRVNFAWGSSSYTLVMSPGYAGTGRAFVHCNALSGRSCVDWTILPDANAANAGIANLYAIAKNGSEKFVAVCRLTFRMHVTYP